MPLSESVDWLQLSVGRALEVLASFAGASSSGTDGNTVSTVKCLIGLALVVSAEFFAMTCHVCDPSGSAVEGVKVVSLALFVATTLPSSFTWYDTMPALDPGPQ